MLHAWPGSAPAMSLLGNFRADQQITQLMSEADPTSPKCAEPYGALEKGGPQSDTETDRRAGAVRQVTHDDVCRHPDGTRQRQNPRVQFREGLADGNERVVKGTAWALSGSTDYNPNTLLDFFDDDEVSKARAYRGTSRAQRRPYPFTTCCSAHTISTPRKKQRSSRSLKKRRVRKWCPTSIARMGGKDPIVKIHLINLLAKYERQRNQQGLRNAAQGSRTRWSAAQRSSALAKRPGNVNIAAVSQAARGPRPRRAEQGRRHDDPDQSSGHRQVSCRGAERRVGIRTACRRRSTERGRQRGFRQGPAECPQGRRLVGAIAGRRRTRRNRRARRSSMPWLH